MPTLSRWCVRAALLYLVAGMALGSWMLLGQAARERWGAAPWPSLHAHVLLVGFLLLLVFGVAFWMFPRVRGDRPRREAGWVAFALVNAGLLLRLVAEPRTTPTGDLPWRVLLGISAVLPVLGVIAFGLTIWPRVRPALTPAEARRIRDARR